MTSNGAIILCCRLLCVSLCSVIALPHIMSQRQRRSLQKSRGSRQKSHRNPPENREEEVLHQSEHDEEGQSGKHAQGNGGHDQLTSKPAKPNKFNPFSWIPFISFGFRPTSDSHVNEMSERFVQAVTTGSVKTAKSFILEGADVNARQRGVMNYTPLHLACLNGHPAMVGALVCAGADVNAKGAGGITPLQLAARQGHASIVESLADKVSNINATKDNGLAALHLAALNDRTSVVEVLIKMKGISINSVTDKGFTALDFAEMNGHASVASLLRAAGEKRSEQDGVSSSSVDVPLGFVDMIPLDGHDESLSGAAEDSSESDSEEINDSHEDEDASYECCSAMDQLHEAIENDDIDGVRDYIAEEGSIEAEDTQGWTALHLAVRYERLEIARFLISSQNANVNTSDCRDNSPLHDASYHNFIEIAELLLSNGANVNATNYQGKTPLHHATSGDESGVVELLLQYNADPNIKGWAGYTPLHYAVICGYENCFDVLVGCSRTDLNSQDQQGDTPLDLALHKSRPSMAKKLQEKGAKTQKTPSAEKAYILSKWGDADGLKELFDSIDDQDELRELVNLEVEGSSPTRPLAVAVMHNHTDVAEILIGAGADVTAVDNQGDTALHDAAYYGHIDLVKLLLEHKAPVNARNNEGQTPLHEGIWDQGGEVLLALLEAGADVNAQNNDGDTALHCAANEGHTDLVQLLLIYNAPVNARNNEGQTPLHEGIRNESGEIIRALLEAGADVNAQTNDGLTALHWAAYYGFAPFQDILIGKNANLLLRTKAGDTALDLAVNNGHLDSMNNLLERMADQKGFRKDEQVTPQLLKALHFAVASDSVGVKVLAFLLDRSPELASSKDLKGRTALHIALANRKFDKANRILDTLKKTGASVLDQDDDGCTPLHYACRTAVDQSVNSNNPSKSKPLQSLSSGSAKMNKLLKIVTRLLNLKDTLHARDNKKRIPMHYAAKGGSVELVEKLLSAAKDQELSHPKPSEKDVRSNFHEKASELGKISVTPTPSSAFSPLSSSASKNSAPLWETATYGMYCSSPLWPNDDSLSLSPTTVERGAAAPGEDNSSTGMNFCLDCWDKKGDTPLALAVRNGHIRVVECLLRGGPMKSHAEEWLPLHIAATLGLSSLVPFLITEKRSDVDDTDKRGQTALHVAASQGHSQVIHTLLAEGASPFIRDASQSVPLHLAARGGHVDVIIALLEVSGSTGAMGPDLKSISGSKDENAEGSTKGRGKAKAEAKGKTPGRELKLRNRNEEREENRKLMQKQKDLQKTLSDVDIQGNTPLHLAAQAGDAECVKALIARGANVFAVDSKGQTPLSLAMQEDHLDVINELVNAKSSVAVTDA